MIHKLSLCNSFKREQQMTAHQEKDDAAEEFVGISESSFRGLPSCTREHMNISTICLTKQTAVNYLSAWSDTRFLLEFLQVLQSMQVPVFTHRPSHFEGRWHTRLGDQSRHLSAE